ncbi:MAG: hypothetical protein J6B85_01130 [Lachnospiraceae bacterium]|nr:hypothetical protein [Lachnospiraceae bacterium]
MGKIYGCILTIRMYCSMMGKELSKELKKNEMLNNEEHYPERTDKSNQTGGER